MKVLVKRVNDFGEIKVVEEDLEVGNGVTLNYYSDETPATIIEIDPKGKWVKVQEDKAIRIDNYGMSDYQEYKFERNEKGRIHIFYKTRRKDFTLFTNTGKGTYNSYGIYLSLNIRRKYFDYSF